MLPCTTNCRNEVCNALLKHGAKIDAKDDKGRTPLHRAFLCVDVQGWARVAVTTELLLNWGADATATDCDGRTAEDLVKAETAPDPAKGPLLAALAKARVDQCSRPSFRSSVCYEAQLAREQGNRPPTRPVELLPDIVPVMISCMYAHRLRAEWCFVF